jgi:hypothetical protein
MKWISASPSGASIMTDDSSMNELALNQGINNSEALMAYQIQRSLTATENRNSRIVRPIIT